MAERIDDIGFGGLKLIQDPGGFCFGVDAVLLADYADVKAGGAVIDLGTGTGVIPLIISRKSKAGRIVGVELQQESAALALRNVEMNGLAGRIEIINADITDLNARFEKGAFDAVVSNPPFIAGHSGVRNLSRAKMTARHETTADLEDFIRIASELLRSKGSFYLVHRPSRLVDIVSLARKYKLEPKRIRLVHPSRTAAPNIMLLHCTKDGNPELRFEKPLYIHRIDGGYTKELLRIYGKA